MVFLRGLSFIFNALDVSWKLDQHDSYRYLSPLTTVVFYHFSLGLRKNFVQSAQSVVQQRRRQLLLQHHSHSGAAAAGIDRRRQRKDRVVEEFQEFGDRFETIEDWWRFGVVTQWRLRTTYMGKGSGLYWGSKRQRDMRASAKLFERSTQIAHQLSSST